MYQETFPSRSISEHGYDRPEDQDIIWRFLNFSKFINMISTKSIPFIRLDRFEDPYEGALPLGNRISDSDFPEIPSDRNYANLAQKAKQCVFVNCWHINEHESAAMWKMYVSGTEGVAIRSSFKRLKDCLRNSTQKVEIAKVKYLDYRVDKVVTAPMDMMALSMHKRKSFDFERELRAVHWDSTEALDIIRRARGENSKTAILIPVDIDTLIESVFVAPTSPPLFKETIESVLSKSGLSKEIRRSSLEDGPIW